VSASQQGIYIVTVDLNGCKKEDTTLVKIDIKPDTPRPTSNGPLVTGQDLILDVLNRQAGCSYSWIGPNGYRSDIFPQAVRGSVIPADSGVYTVTVHYGICTSSDTINVIIVDDTTNRNVVVKPAIFPNPNDGKFTVISKTNTNAKVQIVIYATDGKEVFRDEVSPVSKQINYSVNISGVANGVYRMKLVIDNKVLFVSFTIKV
jgi:hypothetical protein